MRAHLNNYFNFHVCLSFRCPCVRKLAPIPAVVSENVTNKSCLVCVMSEKYASWVTLRPQWDRYRQGEAEVRLLRDDSKNGYDSDRQNFYLKFHH